MAYNLYMEAVCHWDFIKDDEDLTQEERWPLQNNCKLCWALYQLALDTEQNKNINRYLFNELNIVFHNTNPTFKKFFKAFGTTADITNKPCLHKQALLTSYSLSKQNQPVVNSEKENQVPALTNKSTYKKLK